MSNDIGGERRSFLALNPERWAYSDDKDSSDDDDDSGEGAEG